MWCVFLWQTSFSMLVKVVAPQGGEFWDSTVSAWFSNQQAAPEFDKHLWPPQICSNTVIVIVVGIKSRKMLKFFKRLCNWKILVRKRTCKIGNQGYSEYRLYLLFQQCSDKYVRNLKRPVSLMISLNIWCRWNPYCR